ncbi:MAG: hypothetical protein ACX93T_01110 [Bacteroidota bacterium]
MSKKMRIEVLAHILKGNLGLYGTPILWLAAILSDRYRRLIW